MTEGKLSTTVHTLTPERKKLLETLASGAFDTITDLCAAAGVTRNVYYDALNSQEFVDALFKDSNALIYTAFPQIVQKIVKQAKAGSAFHQKLSLELIARYQGAPQVAIQQNTVNNYSFSKEELLEEAYLLVAEDTGKSVEELRG